MSQTSIQPIFVGREREQEAYRGMLNGTSSRWVMVVTGQGGNGKSALLRHLMEKLTPAGTLAIHLNFAGGDLSVDPLTVLEEMVEQLASHYDRRPARAFKRFDTALQEGRKLLGPRQGDQIIIAREHGTVTDNTLSAGVSREQRRQVYLNARKACYDLLDSLSPLTQLVLLLDTCERLHEMEGTGLSETGQWVMNELIPGIHQHLHQRRRQCGVVLASRILPPFEAIDGQEIQHLKLPKMEQVAVENYLQHLGMSDAALRQHIYRVTYGHALCVSIIGALWQERGEQPFTIADLPRFQQQFNEQALMKFIGERVLDKRLKSPYRVLTRYGVLLRSFDLPTLQALFPHLLPGDDLDRWRHLIAYPYIESVGNQRYAFHDLLREIQSEEIRVQEGPKWLAYHQQALKYLTRTAPDSPDRYYHALACDEEQGRSDWWDAIQDTHIRGTRESFQALLQAARDRTLRLSPLTNATIFQWEGTFYYFGGQMQAALASYEQALSLFQKVGSSLGEANVRKAMGDVQQFRKDMQAALASYEQALSLFQKVGDRLGEANCYLAQGRVARQQENNEQALALYTHAYQLYQKIQDGYSQAIALYYRSWVYQAMEKRELAIADMEGAVAIARALDLPFLGDFQERLDDLRGG